jgi:predicted TIM-barrel fold metal-dependent hydrolase
MEMDDLILISVDDHVVEPADMFDGHWPQSLAGQEPKNIHTDNGDVWIFQDKQAPNVGLNAVAGCPADEYNVDPTEYTQMRPGCFKPDDRIDDMSACGVLAGVNFPTFPHFCGQFFMQAEDKEVALAAVRAYNDWHIDEWAGSHPDRLIPISLMPLWDPQLMAEEIRRVAAKGCHAVTFSENPAKLGLPSYHTDHWDPFLAACSDEGVTVCLHIGSSSTVPITAPDAPPEVMISLTPMNSMLAVTDVVFSGIFQRFPSLQIAMSEGGTGWMPYLLERMDYVRSRHYGWTGTDMQGKKPSEVFREHFWTCFIDDAIGVELRNKVGLDRAMWELDYPHSDSTWPNAPEKLWTSLQDIPEADINKITHENAMRCFQFDPFAHRPKERCTVGALRAEASHVDTAVKSMGRRKADAEAMKKLLSAASKGAGE